MDISAFLASLEASGIANRIRDSLYLFPMLEATHVVGLALVFGTIAIVDLRLLGLASARRPFKRMASEILKWTWVAFAITVSTGVLMFVTNASVYFHNPFFRAKMLMLGLAGLNMLVFELTTGRGAQRWENAPSAPAAGKTAAVLSIVLWIGIIFMGRWIGFTTTRGASTKPAPEINFDDLFGGPSDGAAPSAPPDKK
jgi:hypothetical protein